MLAGNFSFKYACYFGACASLRKMGCFGPCRVAALQRWTHRLMRMTILMMAKPLQPLGDVVGGAAKLIGISMVCMCAGGRFAVCWVLGNQGYNGPDTLSKALMNAVSEDCFVGSYGVWLVDI